MTERPGMVTLKTAKISADVDLATGNVTFHDASGRVVLGESGPPAFAPTNADGVPFLTVRQQFNRGTDEGFYGLGQHQNRQMNYNGEDVELAQHNMDVAIPFVVSTRNYGLLWDNNSITRFGNPEPYTLRGRCRRRAERQWANAVGRRRTASTARPSPARQEAMINLQYLENLKDWPAGHANRRQRRTVPGLHVNWSGTITPAAAGLHRFRLYCVELFQGVRRRPRSAQQMAAELEPLVPQFRRCSSPPDKPHDVRVEWEPNSGYIALLPRRSRGPKPTATR